MKTSILASIAAMLAVASASVPQKAVVVSYPDSTPDHVLQEAKQAFTAAGGMITHEYKLIKAFAAKGPEKIFTTFQAMVDDHMGIIEEDKLVHANGGAF